LYSAYRAYANLNPGLEKSYCKVNRDSTIYTSLFHRLGRKKIEICKQNKQQEIEKKHKSNTYITVNRLILLHTTIHNYKGKAHTKSPVKIFRYLIRVLVINHDEYTQQLS